MALPPLSDRAGRTLSALRQALPPNEFAAVHSWLHTFYRFQLEWILDWGRFMLVLKSRQIGNSHTIAGAALLWALFGETTSVISIGEREASEVLEKSKLHARVLNELGSKWLTPRSASATKITFTGGGRVISLPTTSAGRSFSGNVILDELAYYQRPDEVWDGAAGTALHGYRVRGLSTPNGTGNFFHGLWTDPTQHEGYTRHEVTVDDAIADGMPVDIEGCWKLARGDARIFNQLFRCSFLDNELQYIPRELIDGAAVDNPFIPFGTCFAGLDIGKTSDRTELCIVRLASSGRFHIVHTASCKRTSWDDVKMLVSRAFSRPWNCDRLCIDSTGLGSFPAEEAQKTHGELSVEAVNFSGPKKEDMATRVYTMLAQKQVALPKKNTTLLDDIAAIRRVVTKAGNVSYEAPRNKAGHADSFWSLALALRATASPSAEKSARPI
jgi:phage FluMu gp28-like protein